MQKASRRIPKTQIRVPEVFRWILRAIAGSRVRRLISEHGAMTKALEHTSDVRHWRRGWRFLVRTKRACERQQPDLEISYKRPLRSGEEAGKPLDLFFLRLVRDLTVTASIGV